MPSMLSKSALTALIDMRFNIVLVGHFIDGLTFKAFERDLKTLYATTRALEIISEASRRLPADLKDRHSGILWKEMRDAGDRYRHEYDSVEASIIWRTAIESLPPLLAIIEAELAADRDADSHSKGTL